nr:putative LPS assembly protein LptD [Chryseosolibacter indicus]
MIWLYGEAKIKYGVIELEADEIVIDYANNTITAQSTKDSLGNRIGYPIFKNGSEVYETKGIIYNFKTKRARIKEVVTQQGEGYLHSGTAFKNEKNEIFSINNSYTTCNLEHPHFRIRATKTKAIPDDKIVAGPFYLEFNDIPLPAGFLFGMFPAQRESKSGIIFPSYGEERRRGFNFRNGGYFFDISEYIKLAVTGDIYSKGSHALYVNSNYMKRYAYNGSFNFSYSKNRITDRIEDRSVSNDFRLAWSHSPQSKGTGRFSASVNAATSTFNKNNNLMFGAPNDLYNSGLSNITTKLSSNVSYNKRFAGTPFSLGVNLSHNQDLQTRLVDLPLPNLTLNMTNIYPFQRKGVTGPLDNFSIGYSMAATNRITNNLGRLSPTAQRDSIAPFTLDNLSLFFRNAKNGMRHTIPVSYSFKALKFFTVSPSINYEERWYLERLNWVRNSENVYRADTTRGFNRIANYSFSTSLNTRIYGMYFFKNPNSRVKAIRHIINPSISFGYTPDFTKNINYFTPIRDTATQEITQYRSNHEGFVYGGSNTGRAGSIGFGIGNNLEMKVKSPKDTVERKVMLLNNLSLSSSYNLMADSFKLAPIGISANSNILDNLININVSATLDPYNYGYKNITDTEGNVIRRVETRQRGYAWNGGSLGRITSATLALSTNLNPKGRSKEQSMREKVAEADIPEADKQHIMANPNAYVDFDIPWSLNLGYSASYTHPVNQKASIVHSLQMSGDLSISEKWKINYTSGYDFKAKEITTTSIGIARELHCWQLNMNWVPFGYFTSYNITIAVKASVLQDLKLERRKPFQDRF